MNCLKNLIVCDVYPPVCVMNFWSIEKFVLWMTFNWTCYWIDNCYKLLFMQFIAVNLMMIKAMGQFNFSIVKLS